MRLAVRIPGSRYAALQSIKMQIRDIARQQLGLDQMPFEARPVKLGQLALGEHREQPCGRPPFLVSARPLRESFDRRKA